MPFDWKAVLQKPYGYVAVEVIDGGYAYFEQFIKRQIEELKRGGPVDSFGRMMNGSVLWENLNVPDFLERSVATLDADNEEQDPDELAGWGALVNLLHSGQYME